MCVWHLRAGCRSSRFLRCVSLRLCLVLQFLWRISLPSCNSLPGAAEQRGHPPQWSSPAVGGGWGAASPPPRRARPGLPAPAAPAWGERREKPLPAGWGLLWACGCCEREAVGIWEQSSVVWDSKEHETPSPFPETVLPTRGSKKPKPKSQQCSVPWCFGDTKSD